MFSKISTSKNWHFSAYFFIDILMEYRVLPFSVSFIHCPNWIRVLSYSRELNKKVFYSFSNDSCLAHKAELYLNKTPIIQLNKTLSPSIIGI